MNRRANWAFITTLLVCPSAWGTDSARSLADVPVVDAVIVAPADYRNASSLAKNGGGVIEVALAVAGPFEGSAQYIFQVNDSGESPVSSHVTVLRDGLLDDSIRGQRWDISLERSASGPWRIKHVRLAWRCRRGADTERFIAVRCP